MYIKILSENVNETYFYARLRIFIYLYLNAKKNNKLTKQNDFMKFV